MQKVSAIIPSWDKTKTNSKAGFDKGWKLFDKLGAPVNKFSNRIGSEAFWPTSLDKESDKAARILRSFCKDGFYTEDDRPANNESTVTIKGGKQRVLKKIPQKVIQNAVGLAIFTTMRTGLWISGAGGSGVLIARKEDGTWSPPSGILLHTAGLGFLVGVDIYDCVVVINNRKALESFTKIRATLGGEISAVAGPVGVGGVLENDGKWKEVNRPVFTYLKSRGFYAGVQVDGTIIIERTDENERFYGEKIGVADILAGKARHPPYEIKMLMETIKAAEGRSDFDQTMMREIDSQRTPGDFEIASPASPASPSMPETPIFGVPEPDDPDPFGVLALENAGLEIREAGTLRRPTSMAQFEFHPSPTSPLYEKFHDRIHRISMDTLATGKSQRDSYMSTRTTRSISSVDRATQTEMGTQTDFDYATPITSPTHSSFDHSRIDEEDEKAFVSEPEDIDYTQVNLGPYSNHSNTSQDFDGATAVSDSSRLHDDSGAQTTDTSFDADVTDDDFDDEEPVIFEAASAQATVINPHLIKARGPALVNIAKRAPPPPLPPRNSARSSRNMIDHSSGTSPTKEGFEEVDLYGGVRNSQDNLAGLEKFKDMLAQGSILKDETPVDSPAAEPIKEVEVPKFDSSEFQSLVGAYPDEEDVEPFHAEDTFHSLPVNPMETVEIK